MGGEVGAGKTHSPRLGRAAREPLTLAKLMAELLRGPLPRVVVAAVSVHNGGRGKVASGDGTRNLYLEQNFRLGGDGFHFDTIA